MSLKSERIQATNNEIASVNYTHISEQIMSEINSTTKHKGWALTVNESSE